MYNKKKKDDKGKKPKRIYNDKEITKEDWERANLEYFGENNTDWLSEKNEEEHDRFENDDGPIELDFDY